jgi:4-carboxymuconolactone decarboxylase
MPAVALVPYPDPATLSEGARRILAMAPQNIARMLAGSGPLFEPLMGFATALFSRGSLSATLREAVTCRIAYRYDAGYVIDQHEVMGRTAGLTEPQMEALRGSLPSPAFDAHGNAALLLVDAQIDTIRLPEEVVLHAYQLLGEIEFHELFLVVGFYQLMARYTQTLRVDHDATTRGNALDSVNRLSGAES